MKKLIICLLILLVTSVLVVDDPEPEPEPEPEPTTEIKPTRDVSQFEALQSLCYQETNTGPENHNVEVARVIYDRMKPSEKRACMERTDDYLSYLIAKYSSD